MRFHYTRREWVGLLGGMAAACGSEETASTPAEAPSADPPVVLDLHCDTPMRILREGFDLGKRNDYGQVDIPRMREGGMTGAFFSVYTPASRGKTPQDVAEAHRIIDGIEAEVERHPGDLTLARSSAEVVEAARSGKIAILLGVEGGHMIDSSLDELRRLADRGARYLTLTHSKHTPWAGSSGDSAEDDPGLTDFGREVVAELNRLGVMVDISHVSDKTFFGAVETSKAPVIASHSSVRALSKHPRNMTDEMLRRTADIGGVVHINFYNGFLDDDYRARSETPHFDAELKTLQQSLAAAPKKLAAAEWGVYMRKIEEVGRVSFDRLLDHFEHAVNVCGVEHVGLGSDFDGVSEQLPEGVEDVSKIPHLAEGLKGRGLKEGDVAKILGGNTLRVMRDVEAAAERA